MEKEIYNPIDANKCIADYKEYMKDVDEQESVQNFFLMKDFSKIPDEQDIRYMSINDREYQQRVKNNLPLRTIKEQLGLNT